MFGLCSNTSKLQSNNRPYKVCYAVESRLNMTTTIKTVFSEIIVLISAFYFHNSSPTENFHLNSHSVKHSFVWPFSFI